MMTDDWNLTDASIAPNFGDVAIPKKVALIELVRHLARISAENDYKEFLKSIEKRYSGPQQKGPPQ
jgi:hypothetical protein